MITRTLLVIVALAIVSVSVTACGKKSRLDPPPGEKSTYPKVYPRE